MKLTYQGKELDTDIEHELFSNKGKCFNVDITYTEDCWISKAEGVNKFVESIKSYTEVHYHYERFASMLNFPRIAFESDILQTGFTREVNEIESVDIKEIDIEIEIEIEK